MRLPANPRVVLGGREAFGEAITLDRQSPDLALQGDVGGGDAHDVGVGPLALECRGLAEEFSDALPLVDDLCVGVASLSVLVEEMRETSACRATAPTVIGPPHLAS